MKKYCVVLKEVIEYEVVVDAIDFSMARTVAKEKFHNGETEIVQKELFVACASTDVSFRGRARKALEDLNIKLKKVDSFESFMEFEREMDSHGMGFRLFSKRTKREIQGVEQNPEDPSGATYLMNGEEPVFKCKFKNFSRLFEVK